MKYSFLPTKENVKVLGRTIMLDDCRLLCTSGSGVEFTYTGNRLTVSFFGDSSTESEDGLVRWRDIARVLVLVDGRIILDTAIKNSVEKYVVYGEDPETPMETHTVRIIKVSEPRMSSVGLGVIEVEATEAPKPTPDKAQLVEFIGDSITCGYGVDTDNEFCLFSTCSENASKAYAYLSAEQLDVDFSLISYSGHGFISGYTPDPSVPKLEELIQPYYEITAYSYNSFRGINPQDYTWEYDREPDVIVINIGTNDFSYVQDSEEKTFLYEESYGNFLADVRHLHPKAHIICSLGVMGDELFPAVERVVEHAKTVYGDSNISVLHFTPQDPETDGYAADFHPSPSTQRKAASAMAEELKKWL